MNKKLKAKIIEHFGSQFHFALAIGSHESTVSKVIRGHKDLDEASRKKWANTLGVDDPDRLFREATR
ncbi:MAG: hypothetical protein WAP34_08905 [Desulfomonilia bacterium]|jgi:hypothetical protein